MLIHKYVCMYMHAYVIQTDIRLYSEREILIGDCKISNTVEPLVRH